MSDATFARPDLTTFARLDDLGLEVLGQRLEPDRAILRCRVVEPDRWCRRCGCQGAARDTVVRRLAHEPFGWRPTVLEVSLRRYRCTGCGHVWRQDTSRAAEPRATLSRRGLWWALEALVCQHLSVARVADGLGVSWNTANDAVLAEGRRVLIDDPHRFDDVQVIGVDEHVCGTPGHTSYSRAPVPPRAPPEPTWQEITPGRWCSAPSSPTHSARQAAAGTTRPGRGLRCPPRPHRRARTLARPRRGCSPAGSPR